MGVTILVFMMNKIVLEDRKEILLMSIKVSQAQDNIISLRKLLKDLSM